MFSSNRFFCESIRNISDFIFVIQECVFIEMANYSEWLLMVFICRMVISDMERPIFFLNLCNYPVNVYFYANLIEGMDYCFKYSTKILT